ncbi:uncharacterized protein LACBIDRAFT_324583 [Laccaria bicolor S238N-H82]|uniref:Predicted protein n=1 Tax=Laccaria bicolor (strain S238N-H82 / ATCC MYA-4686) TaxID=486041 RepID=B0D2D6_LACBS|nr:uncharacterized protein LACBIDRAFT_324583 [Laccaria bicolor S238N-H82]EDR10728.1 predicted protein [Laccaria bicolor S238N-H82]|eukprot:XP_001878029.1 predicted protein [Laccaria bicolor S238N-H82]
MATLPTRQPVILRCLPLVVALLWGQTSGRLLEKRRLSDNSNNFATLSSSSTAMSIIGHTNTFDEVDIAQEHLNYWMKLSITQLCALEPIQSGEESGRDAMFRSAGNPGLFHMKNAHALKNLKSVHMIPIRVRIQGRVSLDLTMLHGKLKCNK